MKHRLISDLQTSSKLYSLARVGWKVTSSCTVSRGRIVPNPSLGWMSTNLGSLTKPNSWGSSEWLKRSISALTAS